MPLVPDLIPCLRRCRYPVAPTTHGGPVATYCAAHGSHRLPGEQLPRATLRPRHVVPALSRPSSEPADSAPAGALACGFAGGR